MTLLLAEDDVSDLVTPGIALEAMDDVFRLEGEGLTGEPQRVDVDNGRGWLRLMPVVAEGLDAFGFKAMNLASGIGVRYAIWVYALSTGELRGILDARLVTAMRTAATTALATRELARGDTATTAIIGTGAEARTHLEAIQNVRPAAEVRVHSRSPANRAEFIEQMAQLVDARLVDSPTVDHAVAGADIVVLATKSPTPMFEARHLEPGMHVNSIGSARSDQFELALDAFERFDAIICDSAKHVFGEAGDAMAAVEAGVADVKHATNLSELIVGRAQGRCLQGDVTLYKSVGTATQDLALASRLLQLADTKGLGRDLGTFPTAKTF